MVQAAEGSLAFAVGLEWSAILDFPFVEPREATPTFQSAGVQQLVRAGWKTGVTLSRFRVSTRELRLGDIPT